jgi:predicted amidophosphoribosyltransferase
MKRHKGGVSIEGRSLYVNVDFIDISDTAENVLSNFIRHVDDNADAMFYIDGNGHFYFIVGKKWDIEGFAEKSGYLIADITPYNDKYLIGWGVHSLGSLRCLVSGNFSDSKFEVLRDALYFTFLYHKLSLFYPGTQPFRHRFELNGHPCYALYDYAPKGQGAAEYAEARMAKNLVFKFKEGKSPSLAARLLSLAVAEESHLIPDPSNTVLVPVPASTRNANEKRFRAFCKELAASLGVADGFELIELAVEREPNAIKKGMPLSNVIRLADSDLFAGKDVIIVDDVVTRGEQFCQLANYLKSAGARNITGLFLAKTLRNNE